MTGHPVVLVRSDNSTAGAYGAITDTGTGTSTPTAGVTEPVDAFDVKVEFIEGGTVGVAGITYRWSIDGGKTKSKTLALGVANSITIPDTGVTIALGAGTIVAGDSISFTTTAPANTNADLAASLEALRVTSLPFDAVLLDIDADATTVATCDLWLKNLGNQKGKFKTIILTARPRGPIETEAEYRDAMALLFDAAASIDILVCADRADLVSVLRGVKMPRPTGLMVASRGMAIPVGEDAARVARGPLPGVSITDERRNPKYHDEANFPGLDDLRLTTLRTFEGREGVFITNARLLSPTGSDYVYWQHARVINRASEIAHAKYTELLSSGVKKSDEVGPAGERYIAEEAA